MRQLFRKIDPLSDFNRIDYFKLSLDIINKLSNVSGKSAWSSLLHVRINPS